MSNFEEYVVVGADAPLAYDSDSEDVDSGCDLTYTEDESEYGPTSACDVSDDTEFLYKQETVRDPADKNCQPEYAEMSNCENHEASESTVEEDMVAGRSLYFHPIPSRVPSFGLFLTFASSSRLRSYFLGTSEASGLLDFAATAGWTSSRQASHSKRRSLRTGYHERPPWLEKLVCRLGVPKISGQRPFVSTYLGSSTAPSCALACPPCALLPGSSRILGFSPVIEIRISTPSALASTSSKQRALAYGLRSGAPPGAIAHHYSTPV
ncbi:hypothetical protein MSAN_02453300 [Mycena sanguinolenta]|uniref:Uncharacterized protein n=1 Tax=Mycena sanguinolenta TaxID=230812 RepID=A0A8H6WY79_9AGAR|nr:hypothetical protein MSAN_02453300 [Mycena sanguinolenta]